MSFETPAKVALITGASSRIGLGRAMALALGSAGFRVAMVGRDRESLGRSVDDVREAGAAALPILADVSSPKDAEMAVRRTVEHWGRLDILVNNAAISPPFIPFWETDAETWIAAVATNLNGPFFMARAAVGHMLERRWGRIIGISTNLDTMLRGSPYGPSKAGHEALVAVMANHLQGTGVTANVLLPGMAVNTNQVPRDADLTGLLEPEVMNPPLLWLASEASDGYSSRRIVAHHWDESLSIADRLRKASAPAGWPQLGRPPGLGGRFG